MEINRTRPQPSTITAQQIAAKYRGKREIYYVSASSIFVISLYQMLTVDAGFYLPPPQSMTIYWMKSIVAGDKKAVKVTEVQYLYAPQYSTLSIKEMLAFAQSNQRLPDYLPDPQDVQLLPR